MVGFEKSTIYKYMRSAECPFPRPLKFGVSSRWAEDEISRWIAAKHPG